MCPKRFVVVLVLALIVLVPIAWFGRPAYRHYQEKRAVRQAERFIAKGDYRNASLTARQALLTNPQNLDACRMMAELAELAQSTNALEWHRRIAETAPTVENKLRLVAAALRFQPAPFSLAGDLLQELSTSATNLPAFHVLSAERALKLKDISGAIAHFELARRIEPTNELHELNLAVLNLASTNHTRAAAARQDLERLRSNADIGAVALRWLVTECVKQADYAGALRFSEQLLVDRQSLFDDRLQYLTILYQTNNRELKAQLRLTQDRAGTNAAELYQLCAWMISRNMADAAVNWINSCPAKTLAQQPVPLALVDCYIAQNDWSGLETYLLDQKWFHLDFMRWAFLSRAASEQKQPHAADVRWHSAIKEAGDRLGPVTSLLSMAAAWNRETAHEELLWQIAQRFPRERWALRELLQHYAATGNTLGLNKAYAKLMMYDSKDHVARNNFAATSLLLNLHLTRAHQTAKENYEQYPKEPVIASTYAYSLFLQNNTAESLAVFERLKPEALEQPCVALYYGIVLSAGNTNKAAPFLAIAKGANLLPEEKLLLSRLAR